MASGGPSACYCTASTREIVAQGKSDYERLQRLQCAEAADITRCAHCTGLRDAGEVLSALDRCADSLAADFLRVTASLRNTIAESADNTLEHARLYNDIATTVQAHISKWWLRGRA